MPTAPTGPPPAGSPPTRPGLRAIATIALITLVVLGAATATPWRTDIPWHLLDTRTDGLPLIEQDDEPTPTPTPEPPPSTDDGTILTIALLLAGIVFAVLLALAARLVVAARTPPAEPDPDTIQAGANIDAPAPAPITTSQLQDAVTRALAHLQDAATPHDAVIAAWVALEDAATRHGTPRDPAQTPTEFTLDVLHTTPAPATHLHTLRRLYHHARFTTHPVTPDQVTSARTALEHIARALDTTDHP